ncbi:hypothetical protein L615_001000000810 [Nocardioides sp. J9]|uniref:hypothetical protein n=1 Tax=Nocardioides sp. J9 TaxID=935844 RepID=UPI0011A6EAC2|nr:hypothetical protein [Nocardioides sp. J9]TWH04748.1 hypothetical protein L615_001000000810 [Nocardioides sp. J9]
MPISVKERGRAVARAQQALRHLEQHTATTVPQLGAARDRLNLTRNCRDPKPALDAVYALEALVVEVYGGLPNSA